MTKRFLSLPTLQGRIVFPAWRERLVRARCRWEGVAGGSRRSSWEQSGQELPWQMLGAMTRTSRSSVLEELFSGLDFSIIHTNLPQFLESF